MGRFRSDGERAALAWRCQALADRSIIEVATGLLAESTVTEWTEWAAAKNNTVVSPDFARYDPPVKSRDEKSWRTTAGRS
jgi:hypothetical protein